jgi:hypothetical protein
MAAKRTKKGGKAGQPPESIVGTVTTGGKLQIDTDKLDKFLEGLKKSAKVKFVARNAPFMRQSPTLPV